MSDPNVTTRPTDVNMLVQNVNQYNKQLNTPTSPALGQEASLLDAALSARASMAACGQSPGLPNASAYTLLVAILERLRAD
jgi:hypothetical protein